MGLPISISTPLETVRIAKQFRVRSECCGAVCCMLYAAWEVHVRELHVPSDRTGHLNYPTQRIRSRFALLFMACAHKHKLDMTGLLSLRPFALTSTSVLRMAVQPADRLHPAQLAASMAALLLRWLDGRGRIISISG